MNQFPLQSPALDPPFSVSYHTCTEFLALFKRVEAGAPMLKRCRAACPIREQGTVKAKIYLCGSICLCKQCYTYPQVVAFLGGNSGVPSGYARYLVNTLGYQKSISLIKAFSFEA